MKLSDYNKTALFGLVGLGGAFIGAVLFEILIPPLPVAPPPKPPPKIQLCLLIDCSGSMQDKSGGPQTKFDEVKEAAKTFIDQNVSKGQIAVVGFASTAQTASPLSGDAIKLKAAIDSLPLDGNTEMDVGLKAAAQELPDQPNTQRSIFLFTDGMPDSAPNTRDAAAQVKSQGIEVVAVGTGEPPGGADLNFLTEISGKPAIPASGGKFDQAFKQAEAVIYQTTKAIGNKEETIAKPARVILQSAIWAAFLAMGIGLALIIGQNFYLRRPLLNLTQCLFGVVGALVAGLAAGAIGQALFTLVPTSSATGPLAGALGALSRIISWALLGGLLGYGMGFFVPNMKSVRALLGGALGGIAGAIGFLAASGLLGDRLGRFAGTAILGFFIGMMVALVEAVFREAWLEIRYGPKEMRTVSLGREPVSVGSDQGACTIYARNATPIAYRYWLKDNAIFCQDVPAERTSNVTPGDIKQVGNLTVTVCGVGKAVKPSVPAPSKRQEKASVKGDGFSLRLSMGPVISLGEGQQLFATDLPGLDSLPPGGPVAQVNRHPTDPNIQGLQNLSRVSWFVPQSHGDSKEIKPGKSITLAVGTEINFGSFKGEIEK